MNSETKFSNTEMGDCSNSNTLIDEKKELSTITNSTEMVHDKLAKAYNTNSLKDSGRKNCYNYPGSLALSRLKDYYVPVHIKPDIIDDDVNTNKSTQILAVETQNTESPESKRRRIEIISMQCRLHPSNEKYNQGPILNPPLMSPGLVVGYTPAGQRHEVDLNADRPIWFDSEYSQKQFDYATRINVSRMMHDLSKGQFLPDTLDADVESRYHKERQLITEDAFKHFENIKIDEENSDDDDDDDEALTNKIHFLETEQQLMAMTEFAVVKINDFPNELSQKMKDVMNSELSPLMFLKNPIILETIEKLTKQKIYIDVARSAQALLDKVKLLFVVPKSKTFFEYFNSEVKKLEEQTRSMATFDVAIMTEESNKPIEE